MSGFYFLAPFLLFLFGVKKKKITKKCRLKTEVGILGAGCRSSPLGEIAVSFPFRRANKMLFRFSFLEKF